MDIASFIRHVPDYPKPGILFYDITPLLASPEAFGDVIERMADAARPLRPTRIVAAEARGFLFAGCCMLMELDALGGRKVLGDIPLSVLLHV